MKRSSAAARPAPATFLAAPRISLPMRFFLPGVVAFLAALISLPFLGGKLAAWYYQQEILAAVHTLTLGFAAALFFGASVQFLPVVVGRPVTRTRLVAAAHVLFLAGFLGIVWHFWVLRWPGFLVSASLLLLGLALFVVAVAPLLRGSWNDPVAFAFVLSYVGLALTATTGFLMACDRYHSFLGGAPMSRIAGHLHLGLVATFAVAIFGVEAKILPMFLLASPPKAGRLRAALLLTWGGAVLVASALWFGFFVFPGALAMAVGAAVQAVNIREILRTRKRRELDAGFRYAVSAYVDLLLALGLGLAWAVGLGGGTALAVRIPSAYVAVLLVGFVLQTIVGVFSKILPFLVWQAVFAPEVGTRPVPTLKDLSPEPLQRFGFWLFRAASLLLPPALLSGDGRAVTAALAFLALSLVPFFLHVGRTLRAACPLHGSSPEVSLVPSH